MTLAANFPTPSKDLLLVTGKDLMRTLGLPELRRIVSQLLCGVNLRLATEPLTQRRVHLLNIALVQTYSKIIESGISLERFLDEAFLELQNPRTSRVDKIILRWMLGLTGKLADNVLRAEDEATNEYLLNLRRTLLEASRSTPKNLSGAQIFNEKELDWEWGLSLLMAIGAQTLATRGSEKSLYGKFFEKMVMGSVLSVLGFSLSKEQSLSPGEFTLSTTSKRESDATVLWHGDRGIRFDIGFIGKGNPEITLDKVTRFEREIQISGRKTHVKTFIIVDRVGKKSKIEKLARDVDGVIIQMSDPLWVRILGSELESALPKYRSTLGNVNANDFQSVISRGVSSAPIEEIFNLSVASSEESEGSSEE
jgi:hypothetical protein